MATIDFRKTLNECMKNDEFKAEFERLTPDFQIKSALIAKRIAKKLTQAQVANLSGLKQSNVARLESANGSFSLDTAVKYARAVGLKKLTISL